MADEIIFEGSDFASLGRDILSASQRLRKETDLALREIGTKLTVAAKELASKYSQTIPGTIKMRMEPGRVIISAGGESTPIAGLLERGNKKSRVSATTFRHPVFGHDVYVDQPKHPYLRPALAADRRAITRRLEQTWDRALTPYRMRPTGTGGI